MLLKTVSIFSFLSIVLSFAPYSQAQDFVVQNWQATSPGDARMIGVHTTDMVGPLEPAFGITMSFADDLLVLEDENGNRVARLVDHRLQSQLSAALGLGRGFEVGLTLPIVLSQKNTLLGNNSSSRKSGFGDLRVFARYTFKPRSQNINLGLRVGALLPTASSTPYAGESTLGISPSAIADWRMKGFLLSANLGFNIRGSNQVGDLEVGSALTYGVGASYRLQSLDAALIGELSGEWAGSSTAQSPVETRVGVQKAIGYGLTLLAGYGHGLVSGYGTPDHRLFFSATYPTKSSNMRGSTHNRDTDGDGILSEDQCPNEPEDFDGFEDEDGCPEADNDKDGILDENDKCRNHAEDIDGHKDDDGCPDLDNDFDGILDVDDACPLKPEVINGVSDDDGCPDEGKRLVVVGESKIEIQEKLFFANNKDDILPRSEPVLKQLATTIIRMPWLQTIRVEGHTDARGDDAFNKDLAQRRANSVRQALVALGVEGQRLEAKGYGEEQPIDNNLDLAGRANNRRVEFVILKQAAPPEGWQQNKDISTDNVNIPQKDNNL